MSDLTFDDAMESKSVIYNEENTYTAGPKIVQYYRGGVGWEGLRLTFPHITL